MIQMPGLVWPRVSYLIYIPAICLCHCVTFPVITSIEEILTTRYVSDHEKVEGWWDQAGILSIMSRTEPLCYSWVFYPRNSRSNSRIPRQHHFICLWNSGQTGRGAKYIVGTPYLLFTIFALRQRYHLSWLSLTTWHQSLIISYQAGLQQILPWRFSNP